ncbi:MAG: DUF4011 domain-containing protein [Acidimicrobiia bacterium]|nr:DUF4011 domain-containing protein [Acidimicrobiia bacterium]
MGSKATDRVAQQRSRLVGRAVETWKSQLVDLGGRNTLLYFKDLRQGTLDIGECWRGRSGRPSTRLLSGRTVEDCLDFFHLDDELARAARRMRTITAKARENVEERGLETLFLGWWMATWTNNRGTATPAAPVMLCRLSATPRSATGVDFDLVLADDWEVNPTLLHLLATDHDVRVDGDGLLDLLKDGSQSIDASAMIERLDKEAEDVAGWQLSRGASRPRTSATPSSRIVEDLGASVELPRRYAADQRHRWRQGIPPDVAVVVPFSARVRTGHDPHPRNEFLVLDADSSQNYVINAALKGANLVVEGPPGTGKSQTITNLIATLAAHGKRVLFSQGATHRHRRRLGQTRQRRALEPRAGHARTES